MDFNEIDVFIETLSKISMFLGRLKHQQLDQSKTQVIETVKHSLDGFSISNSDEFEARRRRAVMVDSQLNKVETKRTPGVSLFSKKEITEMPCLKDLKYRKTVDGIHQFRYRRNGYNVSFNSKVYEIAKKKAYDFIKSIKNTIKKEADVVYQKTLDYIAEAWFMLKAEHSDAETLRSYKSAYRLHVSPVLGKKSVRYILPLDLQPFFDELFKKSGRLSETVKVVLNGVFKYALANRLCPTNPMDGVVIEKHFRTPGQALTDDQLKRFKEAMSKAYPPYGLIGLIILYTGIRGAELNSLTFDWENGTFTVDNAKLKKSQKDKKINLQRTLPIFPALWPLRHRIETENWKKNPKTLSTHFTEYWSENTVKDLRHTFASKCREAGIENEIVNVWQGHAPGKNVTANTYTHFSMEYQKQQAKKLRPY